MKRSFFGVMPLVVVGSILATPGEVLAQRQTKGKLPVPDAAAQAEALELIRDVYRDEWDRAKKAEEKTALANKLLAQAVKSLDDPAGRFVLLRLARDVAAQAGDAETALGAVDRIGNTYEVDVLQMQLECLQAVAKAAGGSSQIKAVAQQAFALVDAAVAADNYEFARYFGELADASARRARDYPLLKQIGARVKEVGESEKAYAEYRAALDRLDEKPTDPQANLTAGRYLCLLKGDWDQGTPMLALGSDEALKAVASKELEDASSPDTQLALGDAWWDVAEQTEDEANTAFYERAAYWYRRASPKLTQLLKLKVDQRLEAIEKATADRTESGKPRRTKPRIVRKTREVDPRDFEGHWAVKYESGVVRTYLIDASGNVVFLEHRQRGRLLKLGDDVLLDLGDKKLERLRLTDGTLQVEHFNPASTYPYGAVTTAVGTKMEPEDEKR